MPVERQAHAPLTRRDKRLIAALASTLVVGAVALAVVLAASPSRSNAGCVVVHFPSTVGGATLRRCGAPARTLCRTLGRHDAAVAAACKWDKPVSESRTGR